MNRAEVLSLPPAALGRLMPMFLWLGPDGTIRAAGPTLCKILGGVPLAGRPFARHFVPGRLREGGFDGAGGLVRRGRLHLTLRDRPATVLRGSTADLGVEGVLLNLSFGIGLTGAVRDFALTEADFAASDLAMELLYLQEAKDAVLGELRALTGRLEQARRQAEAQALTDPLTGLANRRALDAALSGAISALQRDGAPFALAHLDLDHFKAVNDTQGHAAGDHILVQVAAALRAETRKGDLVARVGGDEFVLLLRGNRDPGMLAALGARLIARLETPFWFEGAWLRISGSIGVVQSASYDLPEAERMLADADAALYLSKRNGRGRMTVFRPAAGPAPRRAGGGP